MSVHWGKSSITTAMRGLLKYILPFPGYPLSPSSMDQQAHVRTSLSLSAYACVLLFWLCVCVCVCVCMCVCVHVCMCVVCACVYVCVYVCTINDVPFYVK